MVAALERLTTEVAGEERERIGVPAWTDAHNMVDFGGAEAVVYGPGDFSVAHLPAEHVDVGEVRRVRRGVQAPGAGGRGLVTPRRPPPRAPRPRSRSAPRSSAAETWIRTRAVPSGTTG